MKHTLPSFFISTFLRLVFLLLGLHAATCKAQDTLVLRDGSLVLATHTVVQKDSTVVYTYFYGDTASRKTPTAAVAYIAYKGGARQSFTKDFDPFTYPSRGRRAYGVQMGKAARAAHIKYASTKAKEAARALQPDIVRARLPKDLQAPYSLPPAMLTDKAFLKGYKAGFGAYDIKKVLIITAAILVVPIISIVALAAILSI